MSIDYTVLQKFADDNRIDYNLLCAAVHAAAVPVPAGEPPSARKEVDSSGAFTEAERRMISSCMDNMEGLSDTDWKQHGFRRATFDSASAKLSRLFRKAVSTAAQPAAVPVPAGEPDTDVRAALESAAEYIGNTPHGDNCYVSYQYEGDPGDRCNCGKESIEGHINHVLTMTIAPQPVAAPVASPENVKMPTEENEAVMMQLLSYDWLKNNAPHRLKDPTPAELAQATAVSTVHVLTDDEVWSNNEIMACNATCGLRMEELMSLVRAIERTIATSRECGGLGAVLDDTEPAPAAEHAREALEEYGRKMYDAGMDAASDFRDRNREGEAKEQDAAEMLDAFLASAPPAPAQTPFGYWHQGATEDESDFYLHKDLGDVRCENCVVLYDHPATAAQGLSVRNGDFSAPNQTPAPAAQGLSKPVAYRAWFDADNGARWLFTLWPEEERLDVTWEPLYTAPPSDSAVIPTHSEQGDLHDSDVKAAQGLSDAEILTKASHNGMWGLRVEGTWESTSDGRRVIKTVRDCLAASRTTPKDGAS